MVGSANFTIMSKDKKIIIPLKAVYREKGKDIAKILANDIVVYKEIILGERFSDGMQEILSGISEGMNVILDNGKYIKR